MKTFICSQPTEPAHGWFIDKLNVWQNHDADLPFIGKHGAIDFDLLTGETDDALKIKGKFPVMSSYSTSVRVHCDGNRVYVEGNPSRFGRPENLFGFTTFEDCIAVYNNILASLGLPPFTTGRLEFLQGDKNDTVKKIYTGANFTHVDITKNHSVGDENCYAFLRALSTLSLPNGKHPFLYPNGATVDWSSSKCGRGSSWDYSKVYIKAIDLLTKINANTKDASDEIKRYYQDVIEHCQSAGIIREEHSFKSKKLNRYDLQYFGHTDLNRLVTHKTLTTLDKLTQTLEVSTMDYTSLAQQLIDRKIVNCMRSANATQSMALCWLNDPDFCNKTPRTSTYYVHKKRLLALGLDISIPFRSDRNVLPMIKNQREIVRYTHDVIPDWYRKPTTQPILKLIA
jgi:II/X family phage/plasmid replication protein